MSKHNFKDIFGKLAAEDILHPREDAWDEWWNVIFMVWSKQVTLFWSFDLLISFWKSGVDILSLCMHHDILINPALAICWRSKSPICCTWAGASLMVQLQSTAVWLRARALRRSRSGWVPMVWWWDRAVGLSPILVWAHTATSYTVPAVRFVAGNRQHTLTCYFQINTCNTWLKHVLHLDKESHTNNTFEDPLCDCVVLALLDMGVKLPGQDHFVLFHLKERQETHQPCVYRHRQVPNWWGVLLRSSYLIMGVEAEWKAHGVLCDAVSDHRGRRQSCSRERAGQSGISLFVVF